MRLSELEKKDFSLPSPAPKYPHGLRITLSPEEVEKLGMKIPEVGSEIKFEAIAKVVEVSTDEMKGDEDKKRVSLQIMEMECDKEKKSDSEVMYGA